MPKRSATLERTACPRLHRIRFQCQALCCFVDVLVPDDLLPPVFSRKATHAPEQAFSVRRVIWLALSREVETKPGTHSGSHTRLLSSS